MQSQTTPAPSDPSTPPNRIFGYRELRIMRRRSWELARQLKIAVGKERNAHPSRLHQRHLDKVVDVIGLIENSLGIDATELLQ